MVQIVRRARRRVWSNTRTRRVREPERSPKARILEAFSKFAETSRRGTGSAIGAPEQTSHSSSHCQPNLDTSHPKRPGAPVLSSFVFLDTTRIQAAFGKVQTADPLGVRVFGLDAVDQLDAVSRSDGRSSCPRPAALVHESELTQPFSVLLGTDLRSHPRLRRCLKQLVISTRHQDLLSKWCERTNLLYLCSLARLVAKLDHCSLIVEVASQPPC